MTVMSEVLLLDSKYIKMGGEGEGGGGGGGGGSSFPHTATSC